MASEDPPELAAFPITFPIVGVGASAGGLEAFTQMLGALPVDTGMAFVLVQHLSPKHSSQLAEILSRATAMPVLEVQDEPRVEPNHVYVIPPGCDMVISQGLLQLIPRKAARGQHHPIDLFFRSLAEDQGDRAIGVVLSGTATDGTLGLEEIKAEGGITFAQDDTAQQGSMPRSAVATGCVDFVLSPEEIAREIGRIAQHPYVAMAPPARHEGHEGHEGEPLDIRQVLEAVHRVTGVDFSGYKRSSLLRRISRRMVLHRLERVQDYARLLRKNPGEVEILYQDVLIHVTRFFRNPETFEALKATILPRLFTGRSPQEPLRIWVLGCSTGEEAYSIAIACAEVAEASGSQLPVQVFATDLNGAVIDKARTGVYSKSILHDVSPARLRRFFAEVDGSYRISKTIRDMCVFARHNVLADPPFSQIDLISCRNLLIYLEPALQQKVLPLLHYALKPAGFLLLGGSETIGSYRDLFEPADAKHRIYEKKPSTRRVPLGQAAGSYRGRGELSQGSGRPQQAGADVQKEADRILLARYVPPGVLVDAELEILQFRGDTGPYLAPAPGKASLNLLKMAREEIAVPLRAAINKARKSQAPVREEGLRVQSDGATREVHLEVVPVSGSSALAGGFLILFEPPTPPPPLPRGKKDQGSKPQSRAAAAEEAAQGENARLVQELAVTREYLQSVIEQQETANEELQSANEEAQSANEELQSINEELETSKEEIQSSNEELATVNDELQNRNVELNLLNNDLFNLLSSVQMAIVIIGQNLLIRRFTPMAEKVFNLIPADIGRAISDIKLNLSVPDLDTLLAEVIATASPREREVQARNGLWYSLRIQPYRTLENGIDGAVILLVDVDTLRRAREYAESIVATVRESLLVLDSELCVQTASQSYYQTFKVTPEETEHHFFYELGEGQWNIPELRLLLEESTLQDSGVDGYEVEHDFEHIGRKIMRLNARRFFQESGQRSLTLLAIEDITQRKELERALHQRVEELAAADRSKNEFLALLAHELRNPLAPLRNAAHVLETAGAAGADSAAIEQARTIMNRQIQNMARLIEDLLDVSRITRGEVRLRKERIELAAFLRETMELIQPAMKARGQELSLSLPGEPVYLDADATRLDQIFGNLLSNAVKFTSYGGHIWVTAELVTDGSETPGEAVVRVRDDGSGMAPEVLPRIFDLFMQADRSYDRSGGGLGIGLTLVRRLVELHGGSVEAHSAGLGRGSEFVVRLPVLARANDALEVPTVGRLVHVPADASPRRVLVVEDNMDTAESLAILLRLKGHEVQVAYDGLAALERARSFHPDVVLLDIGLPGLDGYQVASKLRHRRQTAKALLVALTGYGQEEDQLRAQEAGFDHHLTKPVDPMVIYDLIARPRPVAGG